MKERSLYGKTHNRLTDQEDYLVDRGLLFDFDLTLEEMFAHSISHSIRNRLLGALNEE